MRYLRKETAFVLDGKILIPECISRISNFAGGQSKIVYVTPLHGFISVSINNNNATCIVTAINEANILTLSHEILNSIQITNTNVVTLYLLDLNTIEIFPANINNIQQRNDYTNTNPILHPKFVDDYFIIENKHEVLHVRFSDIYYFEKIKNTHKVCVVFSGGISTFKQDLRDVLLRLDGAFVQCHKAFIVNMTTVRRIEKHPSLYVLHFDNNHSCPCSFLYRKAVTNWKY